MPNDHREKSRTSEEIAADIDRTRRRMDATLDALQEKLKPSALARDAVKRVASTSVRKAAALAENVAVSQTVQSAMKLAARALGSSDAADEGDEIIDAEIVKPDAAEVSRAQIAPRKGKSTAKRITGAAVAAALTAAAVKAVHAAYDKRNDAPVKRRAKSTTKKAKSARASKTSSRRKAR